MKTPINESTGEINLNIDSSTTTLNGTSLNQGLTTTNTFILNFLPTRELKDSKFIENEEGNFIEMTFEVTHSNNCGITTNYSYNLEPKKTMLKERYGVKDGKLQLIKTIQGVEHPGYYVDSTIEWEE